ncbi:glycoside hydrolase family 6 protein [Annulohypoxylon maeteangense]|uniref:glycoside hydrolase family 6 protein n=1 Tax=Annulohypoxylon maeteangense TaxID=1927788 RepID=UPI0020081C7B|nr:glycoside hydrolase family 6 protein [Annulohypoxylon maeteangense]KAI0885514.1 glycoside hydrolase family 6 protein [Annulohypoxylon maeteangense]
MKVSATSVAALAAGAIAAPSHNVPRKAAAACSEAVTLDPSTNVFKKYTLHANTFYRGEVEKAVEAISDASMKTSAAKIADVGSFLWLDSIANIAKFDAAVADVPCENILGLVIYDLPGRDCAAKASNGELKYNELDRYKTEYVDPIVAKIKANPNTAFALLIEPDSLPNLVTNADKTACADSKTGYEEGVAYALKSLNLPNVVMYIDAGHGGWLGWDANLKPGAEELAKVYKNAGSPKQVRGYATNIAGWNSWDEDPGEFSDASDAKYNSCQNEKTYVTKFSAALKTAGFPEHAIVDTGRNAVTGLREEWGDWCNVNGAGFGVRPTADTGLELADAFVWGKPGGESDGTSDEGATRYDSFCGKPDAYKPSPEAGEWNQAYFEMLIKNAKPAF